VYVVAQGDAFVEELRDPTAPVLQYFTRAGVTPGDGCYAEANLEAVRWWRTAAKSLAAGYLLTLDYGYEASGLYAPWRKDGTLLCFYRHNPSSDPFARIGRQDITSHIDLTTVRMTGEEAGLRTADVITQAELLSNLGIGDAVSAAARSALEEQVAVRRAVIELTDPAGLGRVRALCQSRGDFPPLAALRSHG
jgi:SAM-dependent MidA family methyltransferase